MVLNELSLCSNCKTIEDGHKVMQEFLENYTEMNRLLTEKVIIKRNAFHSLMLTEDYSIYNWIADKRIEKRLKDKFRSLINRSHYVNEEDYWHSEFKVVEFNPEMNSIGCLIAYEREDVVISMRTHELWDEGIIKGLYFSLIDLENDGQINVSIPNISQHLHVLSFRQSEIQETCLLISSGQDLWEKKEELYPHLVFCENVRDQLLLDAEKIHIEQIMKRLLKMEEYFATFDGVFDCKLLGLGSRQESESVRNSVKYRQQRIFQTPYGDNRAFYWHIDFAGKYPGRIYFLPDEERKNCLIGYIGKHLPTPTHRTI